MILGLLKGLSWLPLPVLYGIGDMVFVLTFYIVRWRRKLAAKNIAQSFPEKSEQERARILRNHYRNLGRVLAEALWGIRADAEKLRARITIENVEDIKACADRGQSVFLMAAHFCNWEWTILAAGLWLPIPTAAVYKPQRNEGADRFLRNTRTRFGGTMIPHKTFSKEVIKRRNELNAYALVADQTPLRSANKHWAHFLNQETTFFVGTDKLAKMLKAPVFFVVMHRIRRGYYTIRLERIGEPPYENESDTVLIDRYAAVLEREIRASPSDWLWIHNKWKYSREDAEAAEARNKNQE
ncbi:MAG: lysophospholipid acyltransferase family protein [Burkholderiales bacterium]|jgi:KDO2-lipid IV(A) lauroyltransferase|nr:lysophospholipid acyltransferase family protein [Burkholderiales bacterium]